MYVPLLHPASTPTYLPQARKAPFQLEYIPKDISWDPSPYKPKDAFTSTHQLQEGDIVIFATDGVWDNLPAEEILGSVSVWMFDSDSWKNDGCKITTSPRRLVAATTDVFQELHILLAQTVVAMAKSRSYYPRTLDDITGSYYGGKLDDITAVVTVVTKDYRKHSVPAANR